MTRLLDFIVGISVLLVATPIMLLIALLTTCDSPGPILYGSQRVGKNCKLYLVLRFRTVDINTPTSLNMGERLTRVGGFLRSFSLDDLLNLFNVLKGELSLVGPRPTEPGAVDLSDPAWQKVLTVRLGIISWAILELA